MEETYTAQELRDIIANLKLQIAEAHKAASASADGQQVTQQQIFVLQMEMKRYRDALNRKYNRGMHIGVG